MPGLGLALGVPFGNLLDRGPQPPLVDSIWWWPTGTTNGYIIPDKKNNVGTTDIGFCNVALVTTSAQFVTTAVQVGDILTHFGTATLVAGNGFFNASGGTISHVHVNGVLRFPTAEGAGVLLYDVSGLGEHASNATIAWHTSSESRDIPSYNLLYGFSQTPGLFKDPLFSNWTDPETPLYWDVVKTGSTTPFIQNYGLLDSGSRVRYGVAAAFNSAELIGLDNADWATSYIGNVEYQIIVSWVDPGYLGQYSNELYQSGLVIASLEPDGVYNGTFAYDGTNDVLITISGGNVQPIAELLQFQVWQEGTKDLKIPASQLNPTEDVLGNPLTNNPGNFHNGAEAFVRPSGLNFLTSISITTGDVGVPEQVPYTGIFTSHPLYQGSGGYPFASFVVDHWVIGNDADTERWHYPVGDYTFPPLDWTGILSVGDVGGYTVELNYECFWIDVSEFRWISISFLLDRENLTQLQADRWQEDVLCVVEQSVMYKQETEITSEWYLKNLIFAGGTDCGRGSTTLRAFSSAYSSAFGV